jgi:branched-chain amino acid transport system permease protein
LISTGLIGLSLGTQYAMIAIGFTLIFGIMGVINFMHGGAYVLGGYLAFMLYHSVGLPFALAVALAVIAVAALGYIVEVVLVDRYVNDHLATMLITLGANLILITGIIIIWGPEPVDYRFPIAGSFRGAGFYFPYSSAIVLTVCAISIAGMYYLLWRSDVIP